MTTKSKTTTSKSTTLASVLFSLSIAAYTPFIHAADAKTPGAESDFSALYKNFQQAQKLGETERALSIFEKAYPLGVAKYGEDSENAANLAFNFANLLAEKGDIDKAEKYLDIVEQRYEDLYGDESTQYFDVLLAKVKLFEDKNIKVKDRFKRHGKAIKALLYAIEDVADNNPEMETTLYYHTGIAVGKAQKLPKKKSISVLETAHELARKNWGAEAQGTIELNFILGTLYQDADKKRHAVKVFSEIVDIFDAHFEDDHPWEVAAHARLVPLFEKLGDSDKATEHCIAIGKMTPWQDDIKPSPLFRVNPEYPVDYARNRQEGAVLLTFTITRSGSVKDIKVTKNIKGGKLFEEESIKAVKKWRYAPKVVNGETVEAKGQMVQLDFKLDT